MYSVSHSWWDFPIYDYPKPRDLYRNKIRCEWFIYIYYKKKIIIFIIYIYYILILKLLKIIEFIKYKKSNYYYIYY